MSSKYDDYSDEQLSETAEMISDKAQSMENQIQNGFIGQEDVIRKVLLTVIGGGNVLLEGVPGLGKSLLVTLLSETVKAEGDEDDAEQNRIQFTPALLPSDIVGVEA